MFCYSYHHIFWHQIDWRNFESDGDADGQRVLFHLHALKRIRNRLAIFNLVAYTEIE